MDPDDVRREWAQRSGEFSPTYYAHYGPDDTSEAIRAVLDRRVGTDGRVIELGCNVGRHLAHLLECGFSNLHGIEINDEALEKMGEHYPDLADRGTFYPDAIEQVVPTFEDGAFDAVFSVQTLQHVHPEVTWVFAELVRITDDVLITVEVEGSDAGEPPDPGVNYVREDVPLYYRDWNRVFTDLGLLEEDVRYDGRDTMRVFRVPDR